MTHWPPVVPAYPSLKTTDPKDTAGAQTSRPICPRPTELFWTPSDGCNSWHCTGSLALWETSVGDLTNSVYSEEYISSLQEVTQDTRGSRVLVMLSGGEGKGERKDSDIEEDDDSGSTSPFLSKGTWRSSLQN